MQQMPESPSQVPRSVLVGAALLSAPLLLLLLQYGMGRDQSVYLVVARVMQGGGMPYRDAWDVKPPGIFIVYRLALALGGGIFSVRCLEALALLSQAVGFAILTRRWTGSAVPGVWGGVFAIFLHVQLEFWNTGQPESFAGPVLVWALVLVTSPRRIFWCRVAGGLLFGCAALLKPPLGGGLVTTAAVLGWRDARQAAGPPFRPALEPFAAMALGAATVVGASLAWLALAGAFPDLVEIYRGFLPRYTALSTAGESLPRLAFQALFDWLVGWSALIPVGIGLILVGRENGAGLEGLALVAGIVAVQIAGIALQAKFFLYHYGAVLPFGALLAAWGVWRAWLRFPRPVPRIVGMTLMIVLLGAASPRLSSWVRRTELRLRAALSPLERNRLLDALQSAGDFDAAANRAAAIWVRRNTPAVSTLFVWGSDPDLYEGAGRAPASRYIHNQPLRADWFAGVARPRLMQELSLRKPAAILVARGDVIPWVTGDSLDSAGALETFPELRELLAREYLRTADTGRWVCWLRRREP